MESPWTQDNVHKMFRRPLLTSLNVFCTFNLYPVSRDPFFSLQPATLIKMISLQEIFCKFSEVIQNSYYVKPMLKAASVATDISTLIIYPNF